MGVLCGLRAAVVFGISSGRSSQQHRAVLLAGRACREPALHPKGRAQPHHDSSPSSLPDFHTEIDLAKTGGFEIGYGQEKYSAIGVGL